MSDYSFTDSAIRHLDRYQVPAGATRDVFLYLGELQDGDLASLDLIVIQTAFRALHDTIADVYRPRSPLEAQLEYDRAARSVQESSGVVWPAWVAAEDPEVLNRWSRWNQPRSKD